MTSPATPPAPGDPPPDQVAHRSRWWLGVLLFVSGLVAGVLTVGLLNSTTPDFATAGTGPGATAAPTEPAPTPSGGVPVVARAEVNAACLRVINEAQDVYSILQNLDQAVDDVNLQQLDDMVRRLQPIQPRLARDLQDCRVDAGAVADPSGGATPTAAPPGSTSPTAQPSPTG